LDGQTILEPGQTRRIECSAFKLKGHLEQTHGDVAVIVKLAFEDNDEFEGVGFLEAKRRARPGNGFPALDAGQLKRLYKGTDYAKVLLYDWSPVIPGAAVATHYDAQEKFVYLQGLDLSLQPKALKAARDFAGKELVSTHVLLVGISVGAGNLPPPRVEPPNQEQFMPLGERRRPNGNTW
jgi:hypothetical protein